MNELFSHRTASQYQKASPEKGPRKFPPIESDAKCRNITLGIILITFNEVGRFLTDNWIEHRRFPKILREWEIFQTVGEYLEGSEGFIKLRGD